MTKRAAEAIISDFNKKILRNVFQLTTPPSPDRIVEIYLNDTLAYTTDLEMISNYPSSVMYKSLHAEMSESVTRKVVIHDEEDFYTVNSIKLLFTALTYGAIAVKESPIGAYDTLVFPFLAHYLCIDHNSEVFTACMELYPKVKCLDQDIAEIISKLTSTANKYIECFTADTADHMFFADVKNKLLQILACHASHSTDNYQYNWHELNPYDLCTVLQLIETVKFCMFRREKASGCWGFECRVEGAEKLCELKQVKNKNVLTWSHQSLQLFTVGICCNALTSSTKFYCAKYVSYDARESDLYYTVWRHAWQMRYEVIVAYLLQRYNDHFFREHVGMDLDMCLRGLILIWHNDMTSLQMIREMLTETAAMIIGTANIKNFPNTEVIGCLCSLDVVAIFACKTFLSFTKSLSKTCREFDLTKLVIAWMNAAPYCENSANKISHCDAVAIAKLIILSIDFSKTLASESKKREMVQWLTANGGDAISAEKKIIVDALSHNHQPPTKSKSTAT